MKNSATLNPLLFILAGFIIGILLTYWYFSGSVQPQPATVVAPDGTEIMQPISPPVINPQAAPTESSKGPSYPPPS